VLALEYVESLVVRGDELFEAAEAEIEHSRAESAAKFREGVAQLLKAFLHLHEEDADDGLEQLFAACKRLEPSLEAIEDEVKLLLDAPESVDSEDLIDAANEIWDYVIDLISE